MKKLKIALIGAGSAGFGQFTIADLMSCTEMKDFDLTVVLVDVDETSLNRMHRFAEKIKEHYHARAKIEAAADRLEALKGADYVITSVAVRRWDYWQKDFYIPAAYGFRQVYGEGAGPGAAFHTLRSLNLMMPIVRDMERLCPDALLMNYSNPESRVCMGIHKLSKIRTVGLCHGPFETLGWISEALKKPMEEIDMTVGGLNHFHWVLRLQEKATGKDLYPDLARTMDTYEWDFNHFTPLIHRLFDHVVFPAPDHSGEYLGFAWDEIGPKNTEWGIGPVSHKLSAKGTDLDYVNEGRRNCPSYELWSMDLVKRIDDFLAGRIPITTKDVYFNTDLAQPSREIAIPLILDIELDRGRKELAANVTNEGFAISNLPEDANVEIPITADARGIHPVKVGPLPEAIAGICQLHVSIMKLLVEAYRERSKKYLLQALLIDPLVDSYHRAVELMEMMLKVEADHLPQLR